MKLAITIAVGFVMLVLSSCTQDVVLDDGGYVLDLPPHFPKMNIPADNPLTLEKIAFGKKLFEEKKLSSDNTLACISCHDPKHAFSDTVSFSIGVDGQVGERNSTPIFNIGYHPAFFRDGGALTLEMQVVAPIENPLEMNANIAEICQKLDADPEYHQLANDVFGTDFTPNVLSKSLASYLRTLISGNSRYDQYLLGDKSALTDLEKEGFEVYDGKGGCFKCHDGFDFTDYTYQNIGLYEEYQDPGRMKLTADSADMGLFMVPSLRNLSYTAPYMHDGSLETLEEVIELYDEGGKGHWNQDFRIFPLELTDHEKTALKAFLLTLNDEEFINNH
ncbi:cytochrome-c peroxidase [Parvicella tangerina]|uniref:Cytochrome c551 peroxidase n=1 Tax=Parvicella tangerina TaxID=2829795 RepID=A0A916JK42_9FLAO|nr:cytochrome c peroxidase [Parvicella tangerina]CAG5078756.1 Cytochrome c551 peroxidase [Parvicella tangerina]